MRKFNFKWFILVLICATILPIACVFVAPKESVFSISKIEVVKTEKKITEITGDFSQTKISNSAEVLSFLNNFKETLKFSPNNKTLELDKCVETKYGCTYRYNQYDNGIKVYGGQLNVSVSKTGKVSSILGSYYVDLNYEIETIYSENEAEEVVKNYYSTNKVSFVEKNIITTEAADYIAYIFEVEVGDKKLNVFVGANTLNITKEVEKQNSATVNGLPSESSNTLVNVDSVSVVINGQVVNKSLPIDKYVDSSGNETYVLGDKERNIYVADGKNKNNYTYELYTSSTGVFYDSDAVSAYEKLLECYDFYLEKFNIEGITSSNQEMTLIAIVHFDEDMEQAMFSHGEKSDIGYFLFGDGNLSLGTLPFCNALDIVGHEYQHAITDSIIYLEYLNASGAINESFSDIFGACIEGYEISDPRFWKMGEGVHIDNVSYFRDMANPALTGDTISYENMFPYCTNHNITHTNCDNGGVHINSTLLTHATYLMFKHNPETFTKETILDLWYETLLSLSTNADFIDFAGVMMNVAKTKLELSEQDLQIIEYAFAAVDLPGYEGVKVWNNNTLNVLIGTGNIVDPYKINTEADLASLAYYINNIDNPNAFYPGAASRESYLTARYEITAPLDLESVQWISIGTSKYPFNGVFNGGGHTISGLNICGNTNDIFSGLFGYTGDNCVIYDVRIGAGIVESKAEYTGAIVGRLNGSISGCSSELNIIGNNVGGLVGQVVNNNGGDKITSCFTTSDLQGVVVGGIVASFATPKNTELNMHVSGCISACYSTGALTGEIVGGIVAKANAINIANCITLSTIQGISENSKIAGIVSVLQAKDVRNPEEIINQPIYNFIISCRSVASLINNQSLKTGLIVCEVDAPISKCFVYIEKTIVKEIENLTFSYSSLEQPNIKLKETLLSSDSAFEGDFDFDNEDYFTNKNNWIVLDGIEGFDFVSTFQINANEMPTFREVEFWLNFYDLSFDAGYGTEENPFEIATAEQLALLARVLMFNDTYAAYSQAHYKLTSDIDLAGKIWMGIGLTEISVDEQKGISTKQLKAFRGVFDGNGHTIYNMNAVSGYSVIREPNSKTSYTLYEFSASLFGKTCVNYFNSTYVNPVIKNLTLDTVNNRGAYASGVVCVAYDGIDLENITIMGGTITSSYIAGGLVGCLTGTDLNYVNAIELNIDSCYVLANINATIVGGGVGYITNVSNQCATTVNVINFLNRAIIRVNGIDSPTIYDDSITYFRPVAGGVIGVCLAKNLNIINTLILGDIISYTANSHIGGFIGTIGVDDSFTHKTINIQLDGCKLTGNIYYIFDDVLSSAGAIIGGTHYENSAAVSLNITQSTFINENLPLIKDNLMGTRVSVDSSAKVSNNIVGEGDFDFYNSEYFSNSKYFNQDFKWSSEEISRISFSVIFKNDDGTILDVVYLNPGETSVSTLVVPTKESSKQFDYTFAGWDSDLTNINKNMVVKAVFTRTTRSYDINYIDEQGNIIETKNLKYGSYVNQEVKAPEKKGTFFVTYKFVRWGSDRQTITGAMSVKPVYEKTLTTASKIIIALVVFSMFGAMVFLINKNKKFN